MPGGSKELDKLLLIFFLIQRGQKAYREGMVQSVTKQGSIRQ